MGYYADGHGTLEFERPLSTEELGIVEQALTEACFEFDVYGSKDAVDVWVSDKYHGEWVEEALDRIKNAAPIKSGEIEFSGEDGCLWMFEYRPRNSVWLEKNGYIVYDDPVEDNRRKIRLKLSAFAPSVLMEIAVPELRDDEEYIDELLDSMLCEEFRYNAEWEFV